MMREIFPNMTVREAAEHLTDPERALLTRWGETFGVLLSEFHIGHILTYQKDRSKETGAKTVNLEVKTLLDLLRRLQLSNEIDQHYRPLRKPDDGLCLYREHFVKKDGALSKIRRRCHREAYVDERGRVDRYCDEHRTVVLDEMRRALDRTRPRTTYIPGPKMVQ